MIFELLFAINMETKVVNKKLVLNSMMSVGITMNQ